MNKERLAPAKIPVLLKIVAALFFAQGAISFVELIMADMQGDAIVDIRILCIFIGFGLLRLSRAWQIVALLYIAIMVVLFPLFGILLIVARVGVSSLTAGLLLWTLLYIALGIGAWRVLTKDEVHQLFVGTAAPPPPKPRVRRSRPVFDEPEGGIDDSRRKP